MDYSFKLLTFNSYDNVIAAEENASANDSGASGSETETQQTRKEYLVQMFAINEKGKTASIFVEGYQPFFYAKVGDDFNESQKLAFLGKMKKDLGDYYANSIASVSIVKKKKLYGFDGGKLHNFILIKFSNEMTMKKAKNLWYKNGSSTDEADDKEYGSRYLKHNGYCGTILYEAQIPPLLRLFHIKEISPSGWIALPKSKVLKHKNHSTTCDYEFTINYKNIIPLPKKETIVPYKICSFDIEASSSHGDFPLAVKNYKKLATNLVDICSVNQEITCTREFVKSIILSAFGFNEKSVYGVDLVYPISKVSRPQIEKLFDLWIKDIKQGDDIDIDFANEVDDDDEDIDASEAVDAEDTNDIEEGAAVNEVEANEVEAGAFNWKKYFKNKPEKYKKSGSVLELLLDEDASRDTKLLELTKSLTHIFPKLQGDNVTFIGSTFVRYGEKKPYLNHCIARDTCNDLPQLENSVIESYATEKEVLLAWTKLIQKENPDIIIGYNIFGFDYQFMYLRAKELGCEHKFLMLSRNKNEVCIKKDWKTGKEGLEESKIVLASGQYDLKFAKMTGRLQVDLLNYLRREYQLNQYKLDYVSGYFIGDYVSKLDYSIYEDGSMKTIVYSKNLTGLENGSFISFEEEAHSIDAYKNGDKFEVFDVDVSKGCFAIKGEEKPDMKKKVRWGMAKDDLSPQDIFRYTKMGPEERSVVAKYCIQDCNLVHHLLRKIDVVTGYIEMSSLCSVPMEFLVMRGQGIKLTSYIAKKCREKNTLMPVIDKGNKDEGYEGAIVLPPKCNLYLEDPVACVDYSSLYPSSMMSENISHDSKVWTKEYDLNGRLLVETGEKDPRTGVYIYDNLPNYEYVNVTYDTYKWQRKNNNPKAGMEKVKVGYKTCRFAQFPNGERAIMPSIIQELLAARKATRKQAEQCTDEFMQNILDKRQLSIKVTNNSLYGQTGAKTSTFYEKDCAASTTAMGRKLLTYGKRVIEEAYANQVVATKHQDYEFVRTNAEYVYGDTDSVFFKFNLRDMEGNKIVGQKALDITIELAQQAGELASTFLKYPHDLEYEKTFLPFCLLSKKRYVGMLYEFDPKKGKRKSMGIVLKRRDNAPIVKDIYGGVIDILMKDQDVEKAISFVRKCMQDMVDEKIGMDKLIITKSLRSDYKNPQQIAHKVLAERIGKRDPGNKPSVGDRIPFVYIENPDKKALQGERIETPDYIIKNKVKINYSFYITNQIMKPLQQLFGLVLEDMKDFKKKKGHTLRSWKADLDKLRKDYPDDNAYRKKEEALRNKEVKYLLFDEYLYKTDNIKKGNKMITDFFKGT